MDKNTSKSVESTNKDKKLGFFQKLKAKIDQIFEATDLTFAGKIFMLALYTCGISGISLIIFSIVKTAVNITLFLLKINYVGGILIATEVVLWLLFAIALISSIVLGLLEACTAAADGKGFLTKDSE